VLVERKELSGNWGKCVSVLNIIWENLILDFFCVGEDENVEI
jgi:hypothetical protein